jgi:flagellar hook protein FlgE
MTFDAPATAGPLGDRPTPAASRWTCGRPPPTARAEGVVIDYTGTTGFAGEATTSTNNADGYASGTFSGVTLGTDGSVIASYSNGQKQTVGRLALATFPTKAR